MASGKLPSSVVSVDWLLENLEAKEIVILDASWFMPGSGRDAKSEWMNERIPGAVFFDFDQEICDKESHLPHMLPNEAQFSRQVSELGIHNDKQIVVYDAQGLFSAPRVWWMFKAMGHDAVAVLDGGLPAWKRSQGPLMSGEPEKPQIENFVARFRPEWVTDAQSLLTKLDDPKTVVLDARPAARFYAQQPEPREGIRSGHMPNAKSLPFGQLVKDNQLLSPQLLKQRFDAISDEDQQLIFSCGSGVTACILALAAEVAGREKLTVYDGSWTEWGAGLKYPVVS
ncbi:3-mercaptopyruvate sulfurtransferase [Photobacterium sp. CCB-ST2H9]|uniref:3-mercaptopyruvate sulfurtransferase n=1 Tax=unclassified Photobacterium TaxID=2628852 RepID=UPI002003D00E|nr:3-mercaptopyruvate sulfurtransferase [Photobacterium sp. CCB-ST2H9]UTM60086.1 3-mercaptopyruvate sulfurtransferase [Photobacterium sp. CCB-ST2H9]